MLYLLIKLLSISYQLRQEFLAATFLSSVFSHLSSPHKVTVPSVKWIF